MKKSTNSKLIRASNITFIYAFIIIIGYIIDYGFIRKWFPIYSFDDDLLWIMIIAGIGFLLRYGYIWVKYYFIITLLNNLFWIIHDRKNPTPPPNELVFGMNAYYTTLKVIDVI